MKVDKIDYNSYNEFVILQVRCVVECILSEIIFHSQVTDLLNGHHGIISNSCLYITDVLAIKFN